MADKKDTKDATGKGDSKGKGKGKDGKKAKKGAGGAITVAGHPRAVAAIRRAKGFGGLIGFGLAALLSHEAGLSVSHMVERALLAGIAGYLIAWACALTVWRQIITAQARAVVARRAGARPTRRTLSVAAKPDPAEPPSAQTASPAGQ